MFLRPLPCICCRIAIAARSSEDVQYNAMIWYYCGARVFNKSMRMITTDWCGRRRADAINRRCRNSMTSLCWLLIGCPTAFLFGLPCPLRDNSCDVVQCKPIKLHTRKLRWAFYQLQLLLKSNATLVLVRIILKCCSVVGLCAFNGC